MENSSPCNTIRVVFQAKSEPDELQVTWTNQSGDRKRDKEKVFTEEQTAENRSTFEEIRKRIEQHRGYLKLDITRLLGTRLRQTAERNHPDNSPVCRLSFLREGH